MRYLKHMTQAWYDERISSLMGKGGIPGLAMYGLYWRVNDIIAAQMKGKQPNCSVTYSVTRWSLLLSVRGSHVRHLLGHLSGKGLVTVEWLETEIRVTNPNLLKYRDEYSQRSGQGRENVPTLKRGGEIEELDTPTEEEEEAKPPPPPLPCEEEIRMVEAELKLIGRPVDDKVAPSIIAKCREDKPATLIAKIVWATEKQLTKAKKRQLEDPVKFVIGTVAATCHGSGFEEEARGENVGPATSKPSPAKQRIDSGRRVLAKIAIERGHVDPARFDGGDDAPLPDSGSGGEHR